MTTDEQMKEAERILDIVAKACNVKVEDLTGRGRSSILTRARRLFFLAASVHTQLPQTELGAMVGRSPATVSHHVNNQSARVPQQQWDALVLAIHPPALEDIKVNWDRVQKAPGGDLAIVFTADTRLFLEPGHEYRLIIQGFHYEHSEAGA